MHQATLTILFTIKSYLVVYLYNTVNHVTQSAFIGADVMTAPPSVIKSLASHPLTDKGLAAFLSDIEQAGQKII